MTPLFPTPFNGYSTFFVLPAGSKRGWAPERDHHARRDEFMEWLRDGDRVMGLAKATEAAIRVTVEIETDGAPDLTHQQAAVIEKLVREAMAAVYPTARIRGMWIHSKPKAKDP